MLTSATHTSTTGESAMTNLGSDLENGWTAQDNRRMCAQVQRKSVIVDLTKERCGYSVDCNQREPTGVNMIVLTGISN